MMDHPPPRDPLAAPDASGTGEEGLPSLLQSAQEVFAAISEAIYIQDAEGRFLDVNEGAARMYGYPRTFFIGQTPEILSAPGKNDLGLLAQRFSQALQGEPQQMQFWGLRKNGEVFPKELRLYPGTHLGQKVVIAIAQDISERKHAEQTQQATYRVAEAAIESRNTAELFAKIHGIVRDLMPAENLYFALWDRDQDTVSFPYWVDEADPAPQPRSLRRGLTEYVLRSGNPLLVDEAALLQLEAEGEVEPFGTLSLDWLGVPLRSEAGVFGALVVQSYEGGHRYTPAERDLLAFVSGQVSLAMERTRAQAEHHMMAKAVDQARDAVYGLDSSGKVIFVNEAACRELGYSRSTLLGFSLADIDTSFPADQWPAFMASLRDRGTLFVETEHRRRDGSLFPVEISVCHLTHDGQDLAFGYARDITERRAADQALRGSEEKFSKTFQASPDAININRLDGTYTDANPAFTRMSGWTREETLGRTTAELGLWANPADRSRMQQLLQAEGHFIGLEAPFRMKDGSIRTGLVSGTLIQVDGETQLLSITRDISDRKLAEAALRTAEQRLRTVVANSQAIIYQLDPDGRFLLSEGLGLANLGLVPGAVVGLNALEVYRDDLETCRQIQKALSGQASRQISQAAGRIFDNIMTPVRDEQGRVESVIGIATDVTERQQMEEALRQSQKLESLGILAGGIAHDFNNLLTVVMGNLNLAQMHLPEHSPAQSYLTNLEATVLRATELTKQMLAYSGRGHFQVKPHDLNKVVQEVTNLLEVSIPKKIRLHFDLEANLPAIQADAAQIQQVVMNLVTNAADAIGDKEGVIHLSTAMVLLEEGELQSGYRGVDLRPGRHVLLEVRDSGCGIPAEVLGRIFDPFFTTKTTGRGLGLSAMLGILRGHGAGLYIHSEVGRGSTFRLCFPASEALPAGTVAAASPEAHRALQGRVLLVDDEDLILETIGAALQSLGLEVITARDGQEAIDSFREATPRPDLVLMDLTMPRMDGREAFRLMHDSDPTIPVILSSGFTEQDSIQTLSGQGPAGFIQKPYRIGELRHLLLRVLRN